MTKNIKIFAIAGQILFALIYSLATNFCHNSKCSANSYVSFVVILASFAIFDWYFLKLYPRFKNIPHNILVGIILLFPVLFYLCGLILNALTAKPLSVIIIGVVVAILSRALWMFLARGKLSPKLTEYLALKSLFLLILAVGFLAANLNFAISSYLKYINVYSDVYIDGNEGKKSNFIDYKFR